MDSLVRLGVSPGAITPTDSTTMQRSELPHPGEHPEFHPLQHNRCAETNKKIWPKWKNRSQLPPKRTKWWGGSQPIRCRIQNTGNQDAHRNDWVWLQNKWTSEGYTEWNKGRYTENQQWREVNWDSDQQFGTKRRNKDSTRTQWRNKNSKKWGET